MSNAVVEVVLGLVFVFFIFSMLCSGVNELIATTLGKRADFLAAGVWSLLGGSGGSDPDRVYREFWEHPLICQLGRLTPEAAPDDVSPLRRAWRRACRLSRAIFTGRPLRQAMGALPFDPRRFEQDRVRPSYIPPHTFATVVLAVLRDRPGQVPVDSPLRRSLGALLDEAGADAADQAAGLGRWYDAQMERVSGWYKRESKRILVFLAAAVVLVFNVDTVALARTLWTNPTVRQALADAAQDQIQAAVTTTAPAAGAAGPAPAPTVPLPCPEAGDEDAPAAGATATTAPADPERIVARAVRCARSLPLPIGWPAGTVDVSPATWVLRLVGWAITIGALTFGAPFWFDVLNRLGSLRSAGARPKATGDA